MLVAINGTVVLHSHHIDGTAILNTKNFFGNISPQDEPFKLPDVVLCPSAGDGCDADHGSDCLPMDWYISSLGVSL